MKRSNGILQYNTEDCGVACLGTILEFFGRNFNIPCLKEELDYDKKGVNLLSIVEVSKRYGLLAEASKGEISDLEKAITSEDIVLPIIVHVETENRTGHYMILKQIKNGKFRVFDPAIGNKNLMRENFVKIWTGYIVSFEVIDSWRDTNKKLPKYKEYLEIITLEWKKLLLSICSSLIISLIAIYGSWSFKVIVDKYIIGNKYGEEVFSILTTIQENLTLLVISVIVLYLFQLVLSSINGFIESKISESLSVALTNRFLKKLLTLPLKYFERADSGEIVSRFQSIIELQEQLVNSLLTIVLQIVSAILGGIILFVISSKLFMIVLIIIIVYSLVFIALMPKLKRLNKEFYSNYSSAITFFNQVLSGIETIKMSLSENIFANKFINIVSKYSNDRYRLSYLSMLGGSAVTFVETVGLLLVLWRGSLLVISGDITLGELIAFQALMSFFTTPIKLLLNIQVSIQNLTVIINRLNDIMQASPEQKRNFFQSEMRINRCDIQLEKIGYSYGFGMPILREINLKVNQGDHFTLVGASGSGKTTLIKLIGSLYEPTEGKIQFGEQSYNEISLENIRQKIAYVDQKTYLIEGTILENLFLNNIPSNIDFYYLSKVCNICGIFDFYQGMTVEETLQYSVAENGNNLSGGQKQKVGIARSLLKKPSILLLDESTSNIDKIFEDRIFNFIRSELKEMTVICVTHSSSVLNHFEKSIVIENGMVTNVAENSELLKQNQMFRAMFT